MRTHAYTHTHMHTQWHTPHAKEFQFTSVDLLAIHLCGSSTRLCRCRCGCVPLSIDVVVVVVVVGCSSKRRKKYTKKKRQTAAEKKTCFDILNKPQSRRQKRREARRDEARCSLSLGSVSLCDSCCFDTFALRLFDSLAAQMSYPVYAAHLSAFLPTLPLFLFPSFYHPV